MTNGPLPDNIEAFVTARELEAKVTVYRADETVWTSMRTDALSLRGAEREVTAWLLGYGYEPTGRWSYEDDEDRNGQHHESSRSFRLKAADAGIAPKPGQPGS